ncbi:Methionine aminopeptidase [Mycena kentingensis (nom. inval.)]|nr:Methionine aminopeptidase [Mycena kentingensis (nom. inval.)]
MLLSRRVCARRKYASLASVAAPKPSTFGQPLFRSHPHLLAENELTPGFEADEYENRRRTLMNSLPESSIVVAFAGQLKFMSGLIFYKFRPESDFWYLTGFQEPDSAVILEKNSTPRGYRMTLFSAGRDSAKEKWDGARTSFQDAHSLFRADDARSIDHLPSHLRSVISKYSTIFVDTPATNNRKSKGSKSLLEYLSSSLSRNDHESILDAFSSSRRKPLSPKVAQLRVIKSEAELRVMRRAASISGRAHAATMQFTRPGLSESALAAHFEYLCALEGSQRPAYVPVVASGANSLIIHYTSNNHLVRDDELVLIDAGCEFNGYASDITRTYPVSGRFTSAQRDVYEAVLSVQKAVVELCTEASGLGMHQLHLRTCTLLQQELRQIGMDVQGRDLDLLFPHYVSHPIGLDLHESAHFDRLARLRSGMVITIEPGIYVPPVAQFPKHFHDIGIRIEDEVVVGEKRPEVLSSEAPKESSVGPARRAADKAHVPYRGDNLLVGRKTGLSIQPTARNSDGFEDFGQMLNQNGREVDEGVSRLRKKKTKKKLVHEEQEEEDSEEERNGEMSMEVDSPVQNVRAPNSARNKPRPSSKSARNVYEVDFDAIPGPKRRSTPGPSPLKKALSMSTKEIMDQRLSDDDDDFGGGFEYSARYDDDDDDEETNYPARDLSFTEMNAQPDASDDEPEIPEQPMLSSSPGKGKRKAPAEPDEDSGMEDDIAQGMNGVDAAPPSDDEPPPRSPPKKKRRPSSPPLDLPPSDEEPMSEDEQPLTPQKPRSPPKKKKAKPVSKDQPKAVIIRSRGQKENRDVPDGVRRSKRVPIAPLEWWRLEKYEYGGREESEGPLLVPHIRAIVRMPKEPVVPLGARKRSRRRSKTPAGDNGGKVKIVEKIVEVHVDNSNPEEGWDDETETQAMVKSFPDGEEVLRRIGFTAKMFKPTEAQGSSQWSYQRIFGDGDFIAAGQIVIPPNGRKPSKPSKDNTYIFFVIEGAVNLKVCDTSLIIGSGGMFMIPRGNTYFIENIAERDAKLFFTQARKMREGETDGVISATTGSTAGTGTMKQRAASLAERERPRAMSTMGGKEVRRGASLHA